jgi:hypothetical protein
MIVAPMMDPGMMMPLDFMGTNMVNNQMFNGQTLPSTNNFYQQAQTNPRSEHLPLAGNAAVETHTAQQPSGIPTGPAKGPRNAFRGRGAGAQGGSGNRWQ